MDAADVQGPEVVAGVGEVIETGTEIEIGTEIGTETEEEIETGTGIGIGIGKEIVTGIGIEMNVEVVVEVAAEEAVDTEGVGMDRNAITVAVITTLDLICYFVKIVLSGTRKSSLHNIWIS